MLTASQDLLPPQSPCAPSFNAPKADTHNNLIESLLTEYEVSTVIAMSVASVRRWRAMKQGGPKFIKIGSAVRYRPEDLSAWLKSRPTGGGSLEG